MASSRYPLIAREGWWLIGITMLLALLVGHFLNSIASLPFWTLAAIGVFVFRDPVRLIPSSPTAVVSPVDGEVIALEEIRDPYLDRDARRLTLRMHPWGVYSVRSPVQGKVLEPHNREIRSASGLNIPHGVWLKTDEDDDLVMVMNRGRLNNLPRCYVGFGQRVGQGQRCGFVHLGAQVELYLPTSARIKVEPGQFVHAGSDTVAVLVH